MAIFELNVSSFRASVSHDLVQLLVGVLTVNQHICNKTQTKQDFVYDTFKASELIGLNKLSQ